MLEAVFSEWSCPNVLNTIPDHCMLTRWHNGFLFGHASRQIYLRSTLMDSIIFLAVERDAVMLCFSSMDLRVRAFSLPLTQLETKYWVNPRCCAADNLNRGWNKHRFGGIATSWWAENINEATRFTQRNLTDLPSRKWRWSEQARTRKMFTWQRANVNVLFYSELYCNELRHGTFLTECVFLTLSAMCRVFDQFTFCKDSLCDHVSMCASMTVWSEKEYHCSPSSPDVLCQFLGRKLSRCSVPKWVKVASRSQCCGRLFFWKNVLPLHKADGCWVAWTFWQTWSYPGENEHKYALTVNFIEFFCASMTIWRQSHQTTRRANFLVSLQFWKWQIHFVGTRTCFNFSYSTRGLIHAVNHFRDHVQKCFRAVGPYSAYGSHSSACILREFVFFLPDCIPIPHLWAENIQTNLNTWGQWNKNCQHCMEERLWWRMLTNQRGSD